MPIRLPASMTELLSEAVTKHRPDLTHLITALPDEELSEDQREELRQAVADEFCETGLREVDEPNQRGLILEELIDRLGHHR
jgi:hypothetical protein